MSKNVNGKIDAGVAIKPRVGHDNSGFIASHWQPTDFPRYTRTSHQKVAIFPRITAHRLFQPSRRSNPISGGRVKVVGGWSLDNGTSAPVILALSNRLNCIFIAIKNESWIGQSVHRAAIKGNSQRRPLVGWSVGRFGSVGRCLVSADIECGSGGGRRRRERRDRKDGVEGGGWGGARMNSNVKQKHRVTNGVYSRRHCFKWLSDARNLSRFATWQAPLNLFIHPRRRVPRPHFEKSSHYPVNCAGWCSTGERERLSPIIAETNNSIKKLIWSNEEFNN